MVNIYFNNSILIRKIKLNSSESWFNHNSTLATFHNNKIALINTKMQQLMIYLFILAPIAMSSDICEPFGTRLFYGDVLINPNSNDKAVVYFDTHESCSSSFVRLKTLNK